MSSNRRPVSACAASANKPLSGALTRRSFLHIAGVGAATVGIHQKLSAEEKPILNRAIDLGLKFSKMSEPEPMLFPG